MESKIIVFILLFLMIGCSEPNESNQSCFPARDSITSVESIEAGDGRFYLVHRVAGFNDKTEIFEIYSDKPVFDNCSNSNIKPVAADSIDTQDADSKPQFVTEVIYFSEDQSIRFTYNQGLKKYTEQLEELKFVIEQ